MSIYTDNRYSNSLLYPKSDYTSKYSIPTLSKGPSYESKPDPLSYTNSNTAAASYAASRGISSGIYKAPATKVTNDPLSYMPSISNHYSYKRNDSYVPSNYQPTASTIKQSDSILSRDNILTRDPNRRNIVPSPQAQNTRSGVSMERNYTKDYSIREYPGVMGGHPTAAATYAAEKSGVYDSYGHGPGGYPDRKFIGIDSRIKQPTPGSNSSRKSTYGYQEPDEIAMSTPAKNGKAQNDMYARSNSRYNEPTTNSSYMGAAAAELSAERGKVGSINNDRSIGGTYKTESERPFADPLPRLQQQGPLQSNNYMGNSVVNPMAMAVAGKQYENDSYGSKMGYGKNEVTASSKSSIANWSPSEPKGLVGLRNIGNTCFMNSILQCLFNTPELSSFVGSGKYMNEINYKKEKGIARAFGDLLSKMRSHSGPPSYSAESTLMLKRRIEESNSMFSGYEQHDAQEFLKALLEGMNEDLNRVSTKPPYKELTADVGRPLQSISNEWFDYMLGRDNSIITDLFSGQLLSRTTCTHCGYESLAFDNFWDLSLSFTRGLSMLNSCDLERMIEHFLKEELLDDMFRCAKCKQDRKFKKCFVIWRLPKVLVIHLKRFHYGKYKKEKITQNVKFPVTDLDLTEFVKESKDSSVRDAHYSLFAIVNHSGSLNGGHYTAECQNPFNRKWYNFNDSSVRESHALDDKCMEAEGESPYILFYMRK